MELDIITWEWGIKYSWRDVLRLANKVRDNLDMDYRFHLFSDCAVSDPNNSIFVHPIKDLGLMGRHCFCRLRMFDPDWQHEHGFTATIVSLDLDLVIVGPLDQYFKGDDDFMILQGVNAVNPCPFNASIMRLKAGYHAEVWEDFSVEAAAKIPFHEFPDDQGWIWHKLPKANGWKAGPSSGIYGFQKPGWPGGVALPADANIVAFIGSRKPRQYKNLPWIQKYWTEAA